MRLKNEVMVGVVVLLGIVVLFGGALWLSGRPFAEPQRELSAVFREVGELREGNPVKFRGVQVGRVTDIQIAPSGDGVMVMIEVPPTMDLPPDPAVLLAPASLFGDWQASIVSRAATPGMEFTVAANPEVLPGAALPDITELTAVGARIAGDIETLASRVEVAFTEETAIKLRQTVENMQTISEQLTGFVDEQTVQYASVARNIEQATARVDRVAGEVEAVMSEGGEIREILANARRASQNLQQLSETLEDATAGVPSLVANADTTIAHLGTLTVTLDNVLQSVEPQIEELGPAIVEARQALASLNRLTTQIEQGDGTIGRLMQDPALYEEMQRAIGALNRVMVDLQANPGRYIGELRVF